MFGGSSIVALCFALPVLSGSGFRLIGLESLGNQ
jgi:hypothetical protein